MSWLFKVCSKSTLSWRLGAREGKPQVDETPETPSKSLFTYPYGYEFPKKGEESTPSLQTWLSWWTRIHMPGSVGLSIWRPFMGHSHILNSVSSGLFKRNPSFVSRVSQGGGLLQMMSTKGPRNLTNNTYLNWLVSR